VWYGNVDAGTVGDVDVTFDGNAIFGVTAVSLSGVGGITAYDSFGEPDPSATSFPGGDNSFELTIDGVEGGFALAAFVDNDWQNDSTRKLTVEGGPVDTYLMQVEGRSNDSAGRAVAGGEIDSTGSFTTTFTPGNRNNVTSTRNVGALISFAPVSAIPEPSNLLVTGLLLVGSLCRRARK